MDIRDILRAINQSGIKYGKCSANVLQLPVASARQVSFVFTERRIHAAGDSGLTSAGGGTATFPPQCLHRPTVPANCSGTLNKSRQCGNITQAFCWGEMVVGVGDAGYSTGVCRRTEACASGLKSGVIYEDGGAARI